MSSVSAGWFFCSCAEEEGAADSDATPIDTPHKIMAMTRETAARKFQFLWPTGLFMTCVLSNSVSTPSGLDVSAQNLVGRSLYLVDAHTFCSSLADASLTN